MTKQGIFCLEGDWGGLTDRTSVRLGLDMLITVRGGRLIHRNAATSAEFKHYLTQWSSSRYDSFPLAYFSYHGSPGVLHLGADDLTLDDLASMIDRRLSDRILYFASCGTLRASAPELSNFVDHIGAKAVVGYTKAVDLEESAAFDFTLLPELLGSVDIRKLFTRLSNRHPYFVDGLGLRVATRSWASD